MATGDTRSRGAPLDLSPSRFSRLSELLDQSIEMASAERDVWLSELACHDPEAAAILRKLFDAQAACQAQSFLEHRHPAMLELASNAHPALIGRRFGPYRVLSLLGHGGMGSVWLAERVDGLFTRQIALKLVHPALMGGAMTERLAREREILGGLNHPNIARLFDAGFAEDGQPYLALEYVPGTPFTAHCDSHRLPIRERLELFRQVLRAVQYAHAHLVIHRDLKPSNVLVTEDGEVRLLDFGIAKLLTAGAAKETQLTQLSGRALTPDYAAPEQIAGAPITTAADIYALGVMLYELLTGQQPYHLKRDSRGALEEAILHAEPVPPSRLTLSATVCDARATTARKLSKTLKGDLDAIVLKALKKSPAARYATANEFDDDIARFLRADVVLAQRDSLAYRAVKFARRYRVAIATVSVLFLTLAAGLTATTYEASVASGQRDAALQAQLRSLTQTAAARLKDGDVPGALGIILEVLPHQGAARSYTSEALGVFQEARATDMQVLALSGPADGVRSVAFSPEGRKVVTASRDGTARIWDLASGRQILSLNGHTDQVTAAAFSTDGRRVVTASDDNTARIWDPLTGRPILLLSGHTHRVWSAAFSPDGRRVLTASRDKTARIWDAATGREIVVLAGHAAPVRSAAFSPDGRLVVTASDDKTARIWDARTGREIVRLNGHASSLYAAMFSPDGRHVVTASSDRTARIWDVAAGREITQLDGHSEPVTSAAFAPDGQRVVTASLDGTARVWDTAAGRELMRLSGHKEGLWSAVFSPDGLRILTGSDDGTARLWNIAANRYLMLLKGHTDRVWFAAFSPDNRRVVTASGDKTARIWDVATGRELLLLGGHTDGVQSAVFSPDGRRVVTASLDTTARIWDAASGQQLVQLSPHGDWVWSAAFSPDGRRVVTGSNGSEIARIWDAVTGRQILLLRGHTDRVCSAAFSPDGRRVVTASFDKTARLWDAASGQQIVVLRGHTDRLSSAAFSPDNLRVLTTSLDKTARIWDAATGREVGLLRGHSGTVRFAAFSPDSEHIVTGSDDGTARVWDATTGAQIMLLSGHTSQVASAAFSPDGQRIVTASADTTARIWDARVPTLEAQIDWTRAAQFDRLRARERFELGLPAETGVRPWPHTEPTCDESAAAPYDPDRRAPGADRIVTDTGGNACAGSKYRSGNQARSVYQHGRVLMASGNPQAAQRDFENALARGYRAASVDLAMLLLSAPREASAVGRAISLYEQAWKRGVTIAAFELGALYEHGVRRADRENEYWLTPDAARAWYWYAKGADAGEPNALSRFAAREDDAASSANSPATQRSHWLEAFRYYAAAAERSRIEDWPDEAWRTWRYRRASLARLLAREGMMQEVADAYAFVQRRYAARTSTPWERLTALFQKSVSAY